MKNFLITLMFLLISNQAFADWDKSNTALELYFISTLVNDYKQTVDISKHDNLQEFNPIMGSNPGLYFITCALGHYFLSHNIPDRYRMSWQVASILAQTAVIHINDRNGLKQDIDINYYFKHSIDF